MTPPKIVAKKRASSTPEALGVTADRTATSVAGGLAGGKAGGRAGARATSISGDKAVTPAAASVTPSAAAPKRPAASSVRPAAESKPKPKLVRDSFTIPKPEYAVLEVLKLRAARLMRPTKKSEVLRAGIFALNAMSDETFLATLNSVPSLKTGRPKGIQPVGRSPSRSGRP